MKIILYLIFLISIFIGCTNNLSKTSEKSNFLFYLHGKIIEEQGINAVSEKFGKYEYLSILNKFDTLGIEVISEARKKNTSVDSYSDTIIQQVNKLILSGVNAENITILGASKGAVIAMLVSSKLKNRNINYVIMGNCNDWVQRNYNINLYGNILSIYEKSDEFGQSCYSIKSSSKGINTFQEIILNTKLGHGFLYKPLNQWVIPTIKWLRKK